MFKIFRKELLSFRTDRRAMLVTFIVPIALSTVFALSFGGLDRGAHIDPIPLLVVDQDQSPLSRQLTAGLDSVKLLELTSTTADTALNFIRTGKRVAALFFHKGFSDSAEHIRPLPWELEYDASQAQQIGMLQQILTQNLYGKMGRMLMTRSFGVPSTGMDGRAGADEATSNVIRLTMTSVVKSAQDGPGLVQAIAGVAVMMLLFSITSMGGKILEERENGTLKRLLYSPLHSNQILMGKLFASMTIAFIQLAIMLVFAALVFKLHLWDRLPATFILVTATAFACAAFGGFLASVVRSREQLAGLSTLIILIMSAIGGSMMPTFIMPRWMQNVSPISLNYWSVQGFYDIFWRRLPMDSIFLTRVLVLLGIGVVLSVLSFRLFRKNTLSIA